MRFESQRAQVRFAAGAGECLLWVRVCLWTHDNTGETLVGSYEYENIIYYLRWYKGMFPYNNQFYNYDIASFKY